MITARHHPHMNLQQFIRTFDSQLEAAAKLKVNPSAVSHWVNGRRKPSIQIAQRMVKMSKGKLTLTKIYAE